MILSVAHARPMIGKKIVHARARQALEIKPPRELHGRSGSGATRSTPRYAANMRSHTVGALRRAMLHVTGSKEFSRRMSSRFFTVRRPMCCG